MPRIWLPIGTRPTLGGHNRDTPIPMLLYIPGAEHMDRSQLEEIIAWQNEEMAKEDTGPQPVARFSKKEIGAALNEYVKWFKAKREDAGYKGVY